MLAWIKSAGAIAKAFAIAHGPIGLVIAGVAVGGVAIVKAVKSAKKENHIEEHVQALEAIKEELKDENTTLERRKVLKKEKRKEIGATAKSFLELHGSTLFCAILSAALIFAGFGWEAGRLSATASALAGTSAALNTVDSNIRKAYGEDAVRALHSQDFDAEAFKAINSEAASTKEADGTPKDPWREYSGRVLKINNVPGDWIFTWDASTVSNGFYSDNIVEMLNRLQNWQHMLNVELSLPETRVITVNHVLETIGLREECSAAGGNIGWVKGEIIDFGINDYFAALPYLYLRSGSASGVPREYEELRFRLERDGGLQIHLNPYGPITDAAWRGRVQCRG